MFRNMGSEGHFSGGQTPASPGGHGVASSSLENHENSWISLFSVVSRPALSFLQKYLPGRPRIPSLSDNVADWVNLVDEESAFLGPLDDISPLTQHAAPHLACLRCQHDGAGGLMEARAGSTLHWLTADSLREIGIQSGTELDVDISQQTQMGYFSTARSFASHVLLSSASAQEIKHAEGGKDWPNKAAGSPMKSSGGTWWGGFWGSEENSQSWPVSNSSWGKEGTVTGQHCLQQPAAGTKAAVAKTTELFVQSSSRESMPGENAGQSHHKEEPADNGDLQSASSESLQRSEGSTLDHQPSISSHLIRAGATNTACSEVALLTPDQDNGYSSLEEEHSHICRLYMVKALCEEEPLKGGSTAIKREPVREISEEGELTATGMELGGREEKTEESDIRGLEDEEAEETPTQESSSAAAMVLTTPHCQNKAIAYIMGSPCSDDDSQSDSESSEDDDGFDSEGSSVDEDDEDSDLDSEADSETERLWNSLCQSQDPYNPRNFTARLPTNTTAPRTIPTTTTSASPCSTPTSSPDQVPSPLSSSPASPPFTTSSPPQNHDVWDDSTSASEVDEAENHCLWKSFSASSDPFNPLNFQAQLRTQGPTEAGPRAKGRGQKGSHMPPRSPYHTASSPPQYRKEEAEERLDSGFSEPVASTVASSTTSTALGCVTLKKVRFCEEVEEFFASCGEEEDRRGPWEELARDRCRFLRRCQEVEQSISYCLQPQHRGLVYQRMTVWYRHDC